MRGRITNITAVIGMNILFAMFLCASVLFLFASGMAGAYALLIIVLLMISFIPILNHFQRLITTKIIVAESDDPFIQDVDSIINIENFDEMLKETFNRILGLMNARVGRLFFYNPGKGEFELLCQRSRKRDLTREIEIQNNSIIMDGIKGPNDILIKGWLDPLNMRDNNLIEELNRLDSEIVIPIYYQRDLMGLILIGEKKKYTEKEIRLLRIFASKIAINAQNSFYFSNILKRKEFEKEYELTYKLQKQFMPYTSLRAGRLNIQVYHKAVSALTREFYDVFPVSPDSSEIRVSAYRIHGDIKETSILMPGVKALLQCFARLGYTPRQSITVLGRIGTEKDVLLGDFTILHTSISQSGSMIFCNTGYPAPFLYNRTSSELVALFSGGAGFRDMQINLGQGDTLLIACKKYHKIISGSMDEYRRIIEKNYSLPVEDLKMVLVNRLSDHLAELKKQEEGGEEEDRLLILIRVEGEAG